MYGMLTRIVVKPGKRTELLEYLRWDAEVTKMVKATMLHRKMAPS